MADPSGFRRAYAWRNAQGCGRELLRTMSDGSVFRDMERVLYRRCMAGTSRRRRTALAGLGSWYVFGELLAFVWADMGAEFIHTLHAHVRVARCGCTAMADSKPGATGSSARWGDICDDSGADKDKGTFGLEGWGEPASEVRKPSGSTKGGGAAELNEPGSRQPPGLGPAKAGAGSGATASSGTEPATDGLESQSGSQVKAGEALAETLGALDVADGEQDTPELRLPAAQLSEEVEAPETQIKVDTGATLYTSAKSFEELGIHEDLLKGLYNEMKFEKPSRIQAQTLPMILTPPYANLIAQAQSGSGKTTCFTLGMLTRIDPHKRVPQALCMCPTRELVVQNRDVLLRMGKFSGIECLSTADDADDENSRYDAPRDRKPITAQIVIGTPGKLKNWVTKTRQLALKDIVILVFDEADEMMSQDGFADDSVRMLKEIQKATRNKTQILLFSATFSEQVKQFTLRNVPNANKVFVPVEQLSLDVIKQYNVFCPTPSDKSKVLRERIFPVCENLGQTIIFVRTREWARKLHQEMERDGHKCTSIEGGMSHADRDAVVNEFRKGTTKVLISTDVLARGFDQAQVTLVINYDVPLDRERRNPAFETYLHRIGRSGRFGRKGAAFNLICGQQEARFVQRIQEHFNIHIESVPPDDDDAFERVLKQAGLA
eukprot:jgi/Mesvir1/10529/Mv21769-RA.1